MTSVFRCILLAVALTSCPASSAATLLCGDCDGDGLVNVMDALRGAQHAVLISALGPQAFQRCNVAGPPGRPAVPGATVDALDALSIAQFSVGLRPSLGCGGVAVPSAGPYDLLFAVVPATTVSDQPFEVQVEVYVQGSASLAIPTSPLLVTLSVETGTGVLRGSTSQFMTSDTQTFPGLLYGPLEMYSLRASAGAPNGDAVSRTINNSVAVESQVRGSVVIAPGPYPDVRFVFRADGLAVPVSGATFNWAVTEVATATLRGSGSVGLVGQTFIDVVMPALPSNGLYRVFGEIAGTAANDTHALQVGASRDLFVCSLATGRVGVPYSDAITSYTTGLSFSSFTMLPEELPPGLTLTPGPTGTISGTPTSPGFYAVSAFGISGAADVTRIPLAIAIFSPGDAEVQAGIDLSQPGPYAISSFDFPSASGTFTFTNSWDCTVDSTRIRFYYPDNIQFMRRLPAICFIHGNGFTWNEYDDILENVASYGYVIGSVNNPGYPTSPTCGPCGVPPGGDAYGFARATGFQMATYEKFQEMDNDITSPFYRHVDFDNVFWAGHSRGGATTWLNTLPGWNRKLVRGIIPIMAVDPKGDTCLALPNPFPAVPVLSFSAERDGDVIFPIAENPMEDAILSGCDTHVTIYGANHNHTGDAPHGAEATASITRTEQQERIRHWMSVFLERHARGELRYEGQLYLGEHTGSDRYAVFSRRNTSGTIHIDDHEVLPTTTNSLGGLNSAVIISPTEERTYPGIWQQGRSTQHRRLAFTSGGGSNTWSAPAGMPVDTSHLTHLAFRVRQYNCTAGGCLGTGDWQSWISTFTVTLQDGLGRAVTVDLHPRLPVAGTASATEQRFIGFSVPFQDFVSIDPLFDPGLILLVRVNVTPTAPTGTRWVAVDDLRFE